MPKYRAKHKSGRPTSARDARRLDAIADLMNREEWDEAGRRVWAFVRAHPRNPYG